jgi:hypothetical protein
MVKTIVLGDFIMTQVNNDLDMEEEAFVAELKKMMVSFGESVRREMKDRQAKGLRAPTPIIITPEREAENMKKLQEEMARLRPHAKRLLTGKN